jgi:hypothetical protein
MVNKRMKKFFAAISPAYSPQALMFQWRTAGFINLSTASHLTELL